MNKDSLVFHAFCKYLVSAMLGEDLAVNKTLGKDEYLKHSSPSVLGAVQKRTAAGDRGWEGGAWRFK